MAAINTGNPFQPSLWLKGKEDSIGYKIVALIPIVGTIFEHFARSDINTKMEAVVKYSNKSQQDALEVARLLKVDIQYHAIGITRDTLILASTVALFVLSIFGTLALVFAAIGIAISLALNGYGIHMKKKAIDHLQQHGFT